MSDITEIKTRDKIVFMLHKIFGILTKDCSGMCKRYLVQTVVIRPESASPRISYWPPEEMDGIQCQKQNTLIFQIEVVNRK